LLRAAPAVLAVDEVGRGAAAGPCSVGVLLLVDPIPTPPVGLADSKTLSPARRRALAVEVESWLPVSVAHSSPAEVDGWGISLALTLAFRRALASLSVPQSAVVLLDGSYDWANPKPALLLPPELVHHVSFQVETLVRGDALCTAIAAASIVAKVSRDSYMDDLAARHPGYGWERNKGYLSKSHVSGLRVLGFSTEHRRSWSYAKVFSHDLSGPDLKNET
jgi:ribonuclease HII